MRYSVFGRSNNDGRSVPLPVIYSVYTKLLAFIAWICFKRGCVHWSTDGAGVFIRRSIIMNYFMIMMDSRAAE